MKKLILGLILLLPTTAMASGQWGSMTPLGTPASNSDAIVTSDDSTASKTSQLLFSGDAEECLRGTGMWADCANDTAYNATSWNGNNDAATKNALRDWFETLQVSIDLNTAKTSYNSTDSTKVGHISITQDVDLDTVESDTATNNAKITNATHTGDVIGSGALTIAVDAVDIAMLSATGTADSTTYLRGEKAILSIGSGCRCVQHNRDVGGSPNSQHLYFRAIDGSLIIKQTDGVYIEIPSIDIYNYVDAKYPDSLGLGCYPTFVHIDSRSTKARW